MKDEPAKRNSTAISLLRLSKDRRLEMREQSLLFVSENWFSLPFRTVLVTSD